MRILLSLLMTLSFSVTATANENQTKEYMENGCAEVLEDLVKFYLWKNPQALEAHGYQTLYREEVDSLEFDFVEDLEQGAWDVLRLVRFKMKLRTDIYPPDEEAVLTVLTEGDLFCENEKLKSIQSLYIFWDI